MACGTRPFFGGLAHGAGSGHRGSLSCCDWRLWSRANLDERQGRAAGLRGSTDTGPEEPGHRPEGGDILGGNPDGGLVIARLPSIHAGHGQEPRDRAAAWRVGVDTADAVRGPFASLHAAPFEPAVAPRPIGQPSTSATNRVRGPSAGMMIAANCACSERSASVKRGACARRARRCGRLAAFTVAPPSDASGMPTRAVFA
jgi:hypothetical protein